MEFVGKVIQILPTEEGVSRAGNAWKKKGWVAETFGQYPRKVKMDAMNATADNLMIEAGKVYTFSVDLDSREYNNRWYTDVRVFRAVETNAPGMEGSFAPQGGVQGASAPQAPANPFANPDPFSAPASGVVSPGAAFGDETDDLPF
ncbi:MAG: DUF3127 domain-containing protein [Muribaculaceae bacterium]|nr:DUF3127 domain-containing protein [Muribaculaceae bacterium]MDE6558971.1 DUF3127 domain-containing protein [Muribaculaceae bacterium]